MYFYVFVICLVTFIADTNKVCFGQQADTKSKQSETKKLPDKMFPDGKDYDFGTVEFGTVYKHSLRIVNPSNKPMKLLNLRFP